METVEGTRIPVVDFSLMSIEHEHVPPNSDERVQELASSVCRAFSDIGFVYLKNTGISDDEVRRSNSWLSRDGVKNFNAYRIFFISLTTWS